MRQYYIKNKAIMKWYGDELLKELAHGKESAERETAERVFRRVVGQTPVSQYGRSFRKTYKTATGKIASMKPWMQRVPGRLKASIAKKKSKFENGGWVVMAGNMLAYYARIVEFGTKARRQKTTGRFTGAQRKGRRYLRKAIAFEKSYLIKRVRQSIMAMRSMNNG